MDNLTSRLRGARSRWPQALFVLLLLPLACSSPRGTFQSKRDPARTQKLQRVLVVHFVDGANSPLGERFSDDLGARVAQSLAEKGLTSEVVRIGSAELDPSEPIRAAAARFQPTEYLQIAVTSVSRSRSVHQLYPGDLPHFTSDNSVGLEFNVVDAETGKVFWRGQLSYQIVPHPAHVAAQLIEELGKAEYLPATPQGGRER